MKRNYSFITHEQADALLTSNERPDEYGFHGEYHPHGKFIFVQIIPITNRFGFERNVKLYVAINNVGGCAWTEEFTSKREAVKWLHGYPARDANGMMLNVND